MPGDLDATQLETLRTGLELMALRSLGDLSAAEEVAQETLVRVLATLRDGRSADGPGGLGAFAHGIARHVIADRHRQNTRHPTHPLPPEDGPDALREATDDPLARLLSLEEHERVRKALRRLSSVDREILRLSFFEGLTPGEIAEIQGAPATRIRKRKERALERLRRTFFGSDPCHVEAPATTTDAEADYEVPGTEGRAWR